VIKDSVVVQKKSQNCTQNEQQLLRTHLTITACICVKMLVPAGSLEQAQIAGDMENVFFLVFTMQNSTFNT